MSARTQVDKAACRNPRRASALPSDHNHGIAVKILSPGSSPPPGSGDYQPMTARNLPSARALGGTPCPGAVRGTVLVRRQEMT